MTKYIIQVGRNKSKYKTKYSLTNAAQAYAWYSGINIGNGYKKRLVDTETGKVIERYIS